MENVFKKVVDIYIGIVYYSLRKAFSRKRFL